MLVDWLAVGMDPEKCTLFQQSRVLEHSVLHVLLSMITPVPWLERNPTYKEQQQELNDRDLATYGFLGYPVLQAADILIYKAQFVPVGMDQLPHLELTREIARRFNALYRPVLVEPEQLLTEIPKILGTDRRKMSKSYGNAIYLSDSDGVTEKTVQKMITDPLKIKKNDPGRPEVCNVFTYHTIFSDENEVKLIDRDCRGGGLGCVDCKAWMSKNMNAYLEPIRKKRADLEKEPKTLDKILLEGSDQARKVAQKTLDEVKEAMNI
jgi:tryptophanyl-tRNA synthetase